MALLHVFVPWWIMIAHVFLIHEGWDFLYAVFDVLHPILKSFWFNLISAEISVWVAKSIIYFFLNDFEPNFVFMVNFHSFHIDFVKPLAALHNSPESSNFWLIFLLAFKICSFRGRGDGEGRGNWEEGGGRKFW